MEWKIRSAQEHVDVLAAQNQLAEVYANTQNQLSKTQNSRDVEGVITDSNKTLNDVSARWSKSPAAIKIQMNADALRPDLSRIGTVKQVDLMGKEFKITIDKQGELLAGSYATDRAAGGKGSAAENKFNQAVDGGVQTGLVGSVEADEYKRLFRQRGQELEIKNGITNANPDVNQKIYDDISQNRDRFPDVTQEQLDTFKGQALAAFEAHTKFQDWSEGQMALKTQLVPKIQQFTNPATGHFDEGKALLDNADRMAKGEITQTQSKVLAEGFSSHAAELQVGLKDEAAKRINAVDDLLSKHQFAAARKQMAADEPWFEVNGLSADHVNDVRYMNSMESQTRAENNAARGEKRSEYLFEKEDQQIQSGQMRGRIELELAAGKVYEPQDIRSIEGLSDHDRSELLQAVNPQNRNPYVTDGLNKISGLGILDEQKYELGRIFVNQVKSDDRRGQTITDLADQLIKKAKEQHTQAWIGQLYNYTVEGRRPDASVDPMLTAIRKRNTPTGATMQVPDKKTGLMHWSDGKRDLGVVK